MKSRHLTILTLILLGLVGIYFIQQRQSTRTLQQSSAQVQYNPQIDANMINRIEIYDGPQSLVMSREGEGWVVAAAEEATGSALNLELVNDLLGILQGIPVELVSQNPDRQQDLGVTNEQAVKIRYLQGEDEQLGLLVSPTNKLIFRQKDMQNVYKWADTYSRMITVQPAYWLAPTPMPTEEATESGETVE